MDEIEMVQERVTVLPDGRLTRKDAARYLGRKPRTLADWARLGLGPRSRLVGGRRFYMLGDLQAFARGEQAGA
ncbi:MAG: DNA-binding protein [Sphingomonadaceae bacterium]|nr:DNA-binding protein [Sphingomonadaceae bacterium]